MSKMFQTALLILLALGFARTASAQIIQNFEDNPEEDPFLYHQCFAGDRIRTDTDNVIQGAQQLSAGPLNQAQVSYYQTPFLSVAAAGTFSFKHKAQNAGNQGPPRITVDLMDPNDQVVATLFQLEYTRVGQVISTTRPFGRDGIYRVRWTFTGETGNDRVAMDELVLNATIASTDYPACGAVVPANLPPVALPDAATTAVNTSVTADVLANDFDPGGELNPDTVDLVPDDGEGISRVRDIRDGSGALIAGAVRDDAGRITVTPVPGFVGSIVVPYSVRDTLGVPSNSTTLTVTVQSATANLALTLLGPERVTAGEPATYVAIAANPGPDTVAAGTVTFSVTGPIGSFTGSCAVASCGTPVIAGQMVTIPVSPLSVGSGAIVRLTGTTIAAGTVAVQATLAPTAPAHDPDLSNNTASVATVVQAEVLGADLDVSMTGPAEIVPGTIATYTITVTNAGPDPATDVVAVTDGPSGFTLLRPLSTCPTLPSCALGAMAAGESRSFTARYLSPVPPSGSIVAVLPAINVVNVSSGVSDPNLANNLAAVATRVITDVDVKIGVSPFVTTVSTGQPFQLIVTADNQGPNPARQVPVSLDASPGLALVSFTTTTGTFDPGTGIWQIPEVASGDLQELRLLVRADAGPAALTLTARAAPPPTDTDASNDAATAQILVTPSADVGTRLSAASTLATVGAPLPLTALAGNLGPDRSQAVSVRLSLSPGLRLVSATPPVGTFDAATSTWSVGAVDAGVIHSMPVVVIAELATTYLMTARASALGFDPDLTNNELALLLNATSSADVTLTLTTTNPDPASGETPAVRAVVTNAGPSPATQTVVNFATPSGGIIPLAAAVSMGAITGPTQWTIGTLPPNASATLDATVRVDPAGRLPLVAEASTTAVDPNLRNNVAGIIFHQGSPDYDLSIAIAAPAATPVGQTASVALLVRNRGPDTASGVEATLTLPPGLSFVRLLTEHEAFDAATGRWAIGSLDPDRTATLGLEVEVGAVGPHVVTAALSGGVDFDAEPGNNMASAIITSGAAADVRLVEKVDNQSPIAGEAVTATLVAENLGPSIVTGLEVTAILPEGLSLFSASPSVGGLDPATAVWTIGTLAPGAQVTLARTARIDRTGRLGTAAVVSNAQEFDPDTSNNSTAVFVSAGESSDVGVAIRVRPNPVAVGFTTTITVTVINSGPSATSEIFVQGSIPTGLRPLSITPSVGVVDAQGRWSVGTLAVGATATLQVVTEVTSAGPQTVQARSTHANPDPNPVNDQATATLNAGAVTDLRVTMFPGTDQAVISANETIYVVVSNDGLSDAAAVAVDVTLAPPPGMEFVSATTSTGTFDPATAAWTVGSVAAGDSQLLALTVRVREAGTMPVAARIAPTSLPVDPHPANNEAATFIEVPDSLRTVADLQLVLSGPGSVAPGAEATFVAQALNAGSTYALNLAIDLTVPAGLSIVSVTPTFGGSCPTVPASGAAGSIRCGWPDQSVVGQGRPRQISLVLRGGTGAPPGTRVTIAGQVTSLTPDPFPANNAATLPTTIGGASLSDVAVTKVLLPSGTTETAAVLGDVVTYRVTVQNLSSAPVSGATLTDTLAPLLMAVDVRPSQGAIDASAGTWIVGDLAPGGIATLDVVARATASGRAALPAALSVAPSGDADARNDRASITVDVPPASGGGRFVAAGNVDAVLAKEIITGSGFGEPGQVRVFDGHGQAVVRFYAYDPRFLGGVRVASCDLDGDGRDEIITGAGPGGGPHVRIFESFSDQRVVEVNSFYSDGEPYRGGIYVACGDVNGDGQPEVITGTGTIGAATVRVWEVGLYLFTQIASWEAFPIPEARVAACDLNADGRAEVLVTSGPGVPAMLRAFDGTGGVVGGIGVLDGFVGGAFVGCGDFAATAPGPEIVVSADAGAPPVLEFYDNAGARLASVLADDAAARGGVHVAIGDVDGDAPGNELIVGSGLGRLPVVRLGSLALGPLVELRSIVVPNLP